MITRRTSGFVQTDPRILECTLTGLKDYNEAISWSGHQDQSRSMNQDFVKVTFAGEVLDLDAVTEWI